MHIYSTLGSFINSNPSNLDTRDFIKEKIKNITQIEAHSKKAKILQDEYNNILGSLNDPNGELNHIKNKLVEEINKQIAKHEAKITSGNILKATSINSRGGLLSTYANQTRELALLTSQTGQVHLEGLQKRLKAIQNDLEEMNKNPEAPQLIVKQLRNDVKKIAKKLEDESRVSQIFGKNFINIGQIDVNKLNRIISIFHSAQDAVALANGEIGEILAKALIDLISQRTNEIAEDTIQTAIKNAVTTASEYGAGYNIIMGVDNEGKVFSGDEVLKFVDLPNSKITITSHRSKIDTVITYNFGEGLEKANLSVKNYSSFSGLTLVDGTPLDTIVKYIEASEKKGILINALINYQDKSDKDFDKARINSIRASAKTALKARILQNALEGYGETILDNSSKGYADFFVAFNNKNQTVKCVSIPYVVHKFLEQQKDTSNIKVQLNKVAIENFSGTEAVKLTDTKDQNERLNRIYAIMNKEKIHVSISNLDRYINDSLKK